MSKSRVPQMPDRPPSEVQFFDALDRRQLTVSQLTDLTNTATLAEVITLVNSILEAHRTK